VVIINQEETKMACKHQNCLQVHAESERYEYYDCGKFPCKSPDICMRRLDITKGIAPLGADWCPDCGAIRTVGGKWALVGKVSKRTGVVVLKLR
jgi:hypothetical protein